MLLMMLSKIANIIYDRFESIQNARLVKFYEGYFISINFTSIKKRIDNFPKLNKRTEGIRKMMLSSWLFNYFLKSAYFELL